MSNKPILSLNLPRREFLSSALASGVIFLPQSASTSNGPNVAFVDSLPPTPADALSDCIELIREIERSVLQVRYVAVGHMTGDLAKRYAQLKNDAEALMRMVPELNIVHGVSEIKGISDSEGAKLNLLAELLPLSLPNKNWDADSLSSASGRLSVLANSLDDRSKVNLSSEAVKLIRKILTQIFDLQKPIQTLKVLSNGLTASSNKLRLDTKAIEREIKNAITYLAAAQVKESPPCIQTKVGAVQTEKICEKGDSGSASGLRIDAIESVQEALKQLEGLKKTAAKELESLLNDPTIKLKSEEKVVALEAGEMTQIVINLLVGIPRWISAETKLDPAPQLPKSSSELNHMSKSTSATMPAWWDWVPYVSGVRWILQNIIPEVTNDRTRYLVKKKISLTFGLVGEDDQYTAFYTILPRIVPTNKDDLETQKATREKAARKLAQL